MSLPHSLVKSYSFISLANTLNYLSHERCLSERERFKEPFTQVTRHGDTSDQAITE